MTSRERLLAAIDHQHIDHIPMAFMIFSALKDRLTTRQGHFDPVRYVEEQIELGLDAFVDLRYFNPDNPETGHADAPGIPVYFDPSVAMDLWADRSGKGRYPVLNKSYLTPGGRLMTAVNQTDDWPYGSVQRGDFQVPFMDDYLAARCRKFLIENRKDLEALKYLLVPPDREVIRLSRENWDEGRKTARKHDLMIAGGWGVGSDALAWFCGLQNVVFMAIEEPDFFRELLMIIDRWNRSRMDVFLDYGIDLFIRRAWYEGTDFWSPEIFREYFYPIIEEEVKMAHQAGTKYGYILTSGSMPLHKYLVELDVDILIGPDPVQGKGTDLGLMGAELGNTICTWGGINGFITIEKGSEYDIERGVREACEALGPEGFILSPVDNIRDPSDEVWEKILILIESWKHFR